MEYVNLDIQNLTLLKSLRSTCVINVVTIKSSLAAIIGELCKIQGPSLEKIVQQSKFYDKMEYNDHYVECWYVDLQMNIQIH